MIAYLRGTLAAQSSAGVIIDVHGVGYALACSTQTLATLSNVGNEVELFTLLQVRDDSIGLIGFTTNTERELFEKLIGISGVGAKMALAALSTYNTSELAAIIATGDITKLSLVPGVGKKTAQRMVLELKGTLDGLLTNSKAKGSSERAPVGVDEAQAALKSMGFTEAEASLAINGFDGETQDASAILGYALKRLGGAM